FERHRVGRARWIALYDLRKRRRLGEPLLLRRQAPRIDLGAVARVPSHWLDFDVHRLVVRVEQLDAVSVGIAEIDEERMPWPVPSRPALDAGAEAECASYVASV